MIMVLASGISRPFSTMVVQTNTSYSCRMKPSSTRLQFRFAHLPVADADAARCGTSS